MNQSINLSNLFNHSIDRSFRLMRRNCWVDVQRGRDHSWVNGKQEWMVASIRRSIVISVLYPIGTSTGNTSSAHDARPLLRRCERNALQRILPFCSLVANEPKRWLLLLRIIQEVSASKKVVWMNSKSGNEAAEEAKRMKRKKRCIRSSHSHDEERMSTVFDGVLSQSHSWFTLFLSFFLFESKQNSIQQILNHVVD